MIMKYYGTLCAVAVCVLCMWGCGRSEEVLFGSDESSDRLEWTTEEITVSETQTESGIWVDVCGAVTEPGVYRLESGARVYQAVEAAGGFLEEAERTAVNLAAILKDGEQIRILTEEEAQVRYDLEAATGLVNLNTADVQQLCTLTGIGTSRAEDIIAYREKEGPFQSIEEIKNVAGIKEGTYQKIKDKIVVE